MMLRNAERIEEIKSVAMENLKQADNHPRDGSNHDYKNFWTLYRSDVRELLGLINDYEKDLETYKKWDIDTKEASSNESKT